MSNKLMPTLFCGDNFLHDSKTDCVHFTGLTTEYIEKCDFINLWFGVHAYLNDEAIPFTISPNPDDFDSCTEGVYEFEYTANDYTEIRTIYVISKRTYIYNDGTLIINEVSTDHAANVAAHGAVWDSWLPLSETKPYINGQDGIPWNLHRTNIKHVQFGSLVFPRSMARWFASCIDLRDIDFTNLDTRDTTSMTQLFDRCAKLYEVDMSGLDTSNVVSFSGMFDHSGISTLNMASLDTSSVTSMQSMFDNCRQIISLDISGWDTSNVTTMQGMFYQCEIAEIDLCGFDSSSLDNTNEMFRENENLVQITVSESFDLSNVSDSANMFTGCFSLVGGSGTTYDSSHTDKTYAKIDGGVGDEGYFTPC